MENFQYRRVVWAFFCLMAVFLLDKPVFAYSGYFNINNRQSSTATRGVTLYFSAPAGTTQMKISNDNGFSEKDWEPYQTVKTWYLNYGRGTKIVYVKFKNKDGVVSQTYDNSIQLSPAQNMTADFEINNGDDTTDSRTVTLNIKYSSGVEGMIISNDGKFAGLSFSDVAHSVSWTLTKGSGNKTVYMQFKDAAGQIKTANDTIRYNEPANALDSGVLLKGQGSTIYYLGEDYRLHPFSNPLVFHSWYSNFSSVKYVGNAKLREFEIGSAMCVRPGTWLVKFNDSSRVYAVEPGCYLRPLLSEGEAYLLYGSNWAKKIIVFDALERSNYQVRTYDATDNFNGVIDKDHDGVSADTEEEYGTSDSNADTDSDGLTDYEEIYYWYSDPNNPDTDGDGYKDGQELASGNNPLGPGKLTQVPEGTYTYPYGSFFSNKAGTYYYVGVGGKIYLAGASNNLAILNSNRFSNAFVNKPPLRFNFNFSNLTTLANDAERVKVPMMYYGNRLQRL